MTTREFIQHLILNGELEDEICVEIKVPKNCEDQFISFYPNHVTRLDYFGVQRNETLIECKPYKEDN